jgi:hypothetical protein
MHQLSECDSEQADTREHERGQMTGLPAEYPCILCSRCNGRGWPDACRFGILDSEIPRCRLSLVRSAPGEPPRPAGSQARLDRENPPPPLACLAAQRRAADRVQAQRRRSKYALTPWLSWAACCRIPEFTELGKKIRRHLTSIHATLDHGLSNGLIESVNTKIRVITRMTFGFHNPAALIGLAMLASADSGHHSQEDDHRSTHGTGRRASNDGQKILKAVPPTHEMP